MVLLGCIHKSYRAHFSFLELQHCPLIEQWLLSSPPVTVRIWMKMTRWLVPMIDALESEFSHHHHSLLPWGGMIGLGLHMFD